MIRQRGFTLLEVLLATALIASALLVGLSALQGIARASASGGARVETSDRLRTVQGFLRRQWALAQPVPIDVPPRQDALVLLDLRADRLVLVGELPGYLARGGLYRQTYELRTGTDGTALWFDYAAITPDRLLPSGRSPEVLLEGLANARFEARGFGPDGRVEPFAPRWMRMGQLPVQIRLVARFADGRTVFPEIRVPLRFSNVPVLASGEAGRGEPEDVR